MQTNTAVIETTTGDKQIINDLFGGLSIAPYGVFLVLCAYAISQGWLIWDTNEGTPYLGGVLAWLMYKLIRWYYRKKYNFVFDTHNSKHKNPNPSTSKGVLIILAVVGIFVAWYVDANFHSQIRFMPIWFGIVVCFCGIGWLRKNWTGYGSIHVLLGIVPIGVGVLPFFLGISSNNQYFGFEGIYELSAAGIVIIIIGIMEHLIFLNVQNSNLT